MDDDVKTQPSEDVNEVEEVYSSPSENEAPYTETGEVKGQEVESGQSEPAEERKFTQAEVDAIVGEQKAKIRRQFAKRDKQDQLSGAVRAGAEAANNINPDHFESQDDYEAAKINAAISASLEAERRQRSQQSFNEREFEFEATHPDYREKLNSSNVVLPEPSLMAILEDENGPAIAYAIAEGAINGNWLSSLPVHRQITELGKLSERLSAKGKKEKPSVTNAPPKINVTRHSTSGPANKPVSQMTADEYADYYERKTYGKR